MDLTFFLLPQSFVRAAVVSRGMEPALCSLVRNHGVRVWFRGGYRLSRPVFYRQDMQFRFLPVLSGCVGAIGWIPDLPESRRDTAPLAVPQALGLKNEQIRVGTMPDGGCRRTTIAP